MVANQTRAKTQELNVGSLFLSIFIMAAFLLPAGCTVMRYIPPDKLPYEKIVAPYELTQLKKSNTLDVLTAIRAPEFHLDPNRLASQLLTQSDTMVAVSGQSKDLYKTWFSVFVFDEHTMTAQHKYFLCVDEKSTVKPGQPRRYIFPPKRVLSFDCQLVLPVEVLAKPYATDEARQIAILKQVAECLKTDVQHLSSDKSESTQGSKLLSELTMMINQTFDGILVQLRESPGLARQISDTNGIRFGHISLNKGRVRMNLTNDIAAVRIRIGVPME